MHQENELVDKSKKLHQESSLSPYFDLFSWYFWKFSQTEVVASLLYHAVVISGWGITLVFMACLYVMAECTHCISGRRDAGMAAKSTLDSANAF